MRCVVTCGRGVRVGAGWLAEVVSAFGDGQGFVWRMGVMAIVFAVWHVSAVVVDLTTILLCASSERRSRTAYVIRPRRPRGDPSRNSNRRLRLDPLNPLRTAIGLSSPENTQSASLTG